MVTGTFFSPGYRGGLIKKRLKKVPVTIFDN